MRKLAAILLLGVLLYNWLGYRLVYDYLQHRADQELQARLDLEDYDDRRLVEIRIPLNLPYHANWSEFERIDGETEYEGQHYKYVKRRIYNGELVLLCLPNDSKQKLQEARNDFFKQTNGLQHPAPNNSKASDTFLKSLQTEYRPEQNNWMVTAPALCKGLFYKQDFLLHSLFKKDTPEKPPDVHTV